MDATLVNNAGNTSWDLVVNSFDSPKWIGNLSNVWDVNGVNNWKLINAGTPTNYQEDLATYSTTDSVLFDDTASGSGAVSVNVSTTVSPSTIAINNPTRDYTFSGSARSQAADR